MSAPNIQLAVYREISLKQQIGQLRAVPVNLGQGQPKAFLLIYAEDAEIDPYGPMFFFPSGTNKLMLVTQDYEHPFYGINQRLTACGYNLFNLGGI